MTSYLADKDYEMYYTHDVHCNAGRSKPKWTEGTGCSCYNEERLERLRKQHDALAEQVKHSNRHVSLIIGSVTMAIILLSGVAFWVFLFFNLIKNVG